VACTVKKINFSSFNTHEVPSQMNRYKLVDSKFLGHLHQLLPSKLGHRPCLCIKNNFKGSCTNLLQLQQQTSVHFHVTPLNQNRSHITMWTLPIKQKPFMNKMYSHVAVLSQFTTIHYCHEMQKYAGKLNHTAIWCS
jgi:hypothetical protein